MKVLYYQCFVGGISGKKNLAAMVSLGIDLSYIIKEINKLGLEQRYIREIFKDFTTDLNRHGVMSSMHENLHAIISEYGDSESSEKNVVNIACKKNIACAAHELDNVDKVEKVQDDLSVKIISNFDDICNENFSDYSKVNNDIKTCKYMHEYMHDNMDEYNHVSYQEHEIINSDVENSEYYTYSTIQKLIKDNTLSSNIQNRSLHTFEKLAEAQAKVRGTTKENMNYCKKAVSEALIYIVGAAICLDQLQVDKVFASRVELGTDLQTVVLELVKEIPIRIGRSQVEATTPVGAAILAANVDEFTDDLELVIETVGYRVLLGTMRQKKEAKNQAQLERTRQYMIETNIDDMNPEFFSLAEERLFAAGALDVFRIPIMMKKGRQAIKLCVLTNQDKVAAMEEIILWNTTAIGLRKYPVDKVMLPRQIEKINTKYGEVSIKVCYLDGQRIKAKPEFEDCQRLAKENNLTLSEIYEEVNRCHSVQREGV